MRPSPRTRGALEQPWAAVGEEWWPVEAHHKAVRQWQCAQAYSTLLTILGTASATPFDENKGD